MLNCPVTMFVSKTKSWCCVSRAGTRVGKKKHARLFLSTFSFRLLRILLVDLRSQRKAISKHIWHNNLTQFNALVPATRSYSVGPGLSETTYRILACCSWYIKGTRDLRLTLPRVLNPIEVDTIRASSPTKCRLKNIFRVG